MPMTQAETNISLSFPQQPSLRTIENSCNANVMTTINEMIDYIIAFARMLCREGTGHPLENSMRLLFFFFPGIDILRMFSLRECIIYSMESPKNCGSPRESPIYSRSRRRFVLRSFEFYYRAIRNDSISAKNISKIERCVPRKS